MPTPEVEELAKMIKNVHCSLVDYSINIWDNEYRPKNIIRGL